MRTTREGRPIAGKRTAAAPVSNPPLCLPVAVRRPPFPPSRGRPGLSSTSRGSSGLSFTRYPLPRRRGLRRPADGTDPTARPGRHGLAHR